MSVITGLNIVPQCSYGLTGPLKISSSVGGQIPAICETVNFTLCIESLHTLPHSLSRLQITCNTCYQEHSIEVFATLCYLEEDRKKICIHSIEIHFFFAYMLVCSWMNLCQGKTHTYIGFSVRSLVKAEIATPSEPSIDSGIGLICAVSQGPLNVSLQLYQGLLVEPLYSPCIRTSGKPSDTSQSSLHGLCVLTHHRLISFTQFDGILCQQTLHMGSIMIDRQQNPWN